MKTIAIVFTQPPHKLAASREALDAALALSAYHTVQIYFLADGLLNLLPQQQPQQILSRDFIKTFAVLALYEVEQIYCSQSDLVNYQLDPTSFIMPLQACSEEQLQQQLTQADTILRF